MSVFRSFWFGEELPLYHRMAMRSFIDHGHQYTLYAYRQVDAPDGVEVRDASEILPESRVFFYQSGSGRGSVAGFSNLFRYHLLHRLGDWWVDADVVCLADSIETSDTFLAWEDEKCIGSAVLRFPAGHGLTAELAAAADSAGRGIAWGETGPKLVTRKAAEWDLLKSAEPAGRAFPVAAQDALQALLPEAAEAVRAKTKEASFLHLWNEIFRRAGVLTWIMPPPGSYLAELFQKHPLGLASTPRAYSAEQVARLAKSFAIQLRWKAGEERLALADADNARLRAAATELEAQLDTLRQRIAANKAAAREAVLVRADRHRLQTIAGRLQAELDEMRAASLSGRLASVLALLRLKRRPMSST